MPFRAISCQNGRAYCISGHLYSIFVKRIYRSMDTFQNLVAWYNIIGRSLTMVVVLASVSKISPDPGLALDLESEKLKATWPPEIL